MNYENLSESVRSFLMLDEPSLGGGTTILARSLVQKINPEIWKRINLIVGGEDKHPLSENKKNVIWIHDDIYPPHRNNFANPIFLKKIDCIVFVSHWQYQMYRTYYDLPEGRCIVIQNATEKCNLIPQRDKKIKMIYATTPFRGLNVLLDAFEILNRSDVELEVYSSTIVYGKSNHENTEKIFLPVFERASQTSGVKYFGHVTNAELKNKLLAGHIYAYPSIFRETSCLSGIEAAISGMSVVTTNLGVLPETLGSWATYVNFDKNMKNLSIKFAHALNTAIDQYWNADTQERLEEQHNYFNSFWTWEKRVPEWESLFRQLSR